MRLKYVIAGVAFAGVLCADALGTKADAQDSIYVPLLTYRTGPFAGSGIPIANGMADYLQMLNERDGGIGGVKLVVEECETSYDTKKVSNATSRSRPRSRWSSIHIPPASHCN